MAKLRIGVMMETAQISDLACIDILDQLSTTHVKLVAEYGMAQFLPQAVDMEYFYISTTLEPSLLAPEIRFIPTHTYDNAPHDLDVLFIGGVPIDFRPPQAERYMREASKSIGLIFTTCVGSLWLASSGALDGKKATTNRLALGFARSLYPEVDWVEQRWVVDGKFWTAGGAGSGLDMVATYCLENYPKDFVTLSCLQGLDMDPHARGQYYKS